MNEQLSSPSALDPSPEVSHPHYQYNLLVGHPRTDGTFKSSEQLRSDYIHRTDELIRLMTDGVEVADPVSGEHTVERPDYVVWLDKSARPVAWLTDELWDRLAPDPSDPTVPKQPAFRFVNIDREQWNNVVDPSGVGRMDIERVDPTVIRSLRSIFVNVQNKQEGLTPAIDAAPAELDNKTVLIVDEVQSTGRTLDVAEKFFKRAFPTARIAGVHWMTGIVQKNGAIGNADLPVWYKEKDVTGRGVANRNENVSQASKSLTQRLGGLFLSTAFPAPDPNSVQLRQEIKQLAHDPEVLVIPSLQRDDFDERAIAANSLRSIADYIEAKHRLDQH